MFDKLKDLHSYHKIQTCGHALADFYVTCKNCQLHIHDTTIQLQHLLKRVSRKWIMLIFYKDYLKKKFEDVLKYYKQPSWVKKHQFLILPQS